MTVGGIKAYSRQKTGIANRHIIIGNFLFILTYSDLIILLKPSFDTLFQVKTLLRKNNKRVEK